MEAYTSFAEVYDTFMDNVPYEEWGGYIRRILCENDINDGILLDLGCGTGTMTELFAGFGYDMIGVDTLLRLLLRHVSLFIVIVPNPLLISPSTANQYCAIEAKQSQAF